MDLTRAAQFALVMLSPTLIFGAAVYLPRLARAVWDRVHPEEPVAPLPRPIEQLARDLHRLLHEHQGLLHTTEVALQARRLRAVEAAITDCALEAAGALGVPAPDRPGPSGLRPAALGRLLRDLAGAGLVLPRGVELLDGDRKP